jgi:Ca2+-binding RTX toxin-like protein
VSADLSAGTATGEGNDTLTNFNILHGSRHDDTLVGSEGAEHILGGDGADNMQAKGGDDHVYADNGDDTVDGGDGLDTISYWFLARLVKIDLGAGEAVEGHEFFNQDFDTFTSIEAAIGSDYEDELIGSSGDDILDGGEGNDIVRGLGGDHDVVRGGLGDDTIDGGDGSADMATFSDSAAGVTANLDDGTATGQGNDSLVDVEGLAGGPYNDRLTGDGSGNHLAGGPGDDQLIGAGGFDAVYFQSSTTGVAAQLESRTATGEGNDSFDAIEALVGSAFADELRGDAAANVILGGPGDDAINGLAGSDYIDAGDGTDSAEGDAGDDECIGAETPTNCESTSASNHSLSDEHASLVAFSRLQPALTVVDKAFEEIPTYGKFNF